MKVYDGTATDGATGTDPDRIKVGIAEYEVTVDDAVLTTSGLGSCLGVALYDPATGVAGLVHVMLPRAEEVGDGNSAKFADTGTELLFSELTDAGAEADGVVAKIAGGSDMLDFSEGGSGIGERNSETVSEVLEDAGVPIVAEDVGGDHGRSVRLDARTGEFHVNSANRGSTTL